MKLAKNEQVIREYDYVDTKNYQESLIITNRRLIVARESKTLLSTEEVLIDNIVGVKAKLEEVLTQKKGWFFWVFTLFVSFSVFLMLNIMLLVAPEVIGQDSILPTVITDAAISALFISSIIMLRRIKKSQVSYTQVELIAYLNQPFSQALAVDCSTKKGKVEKVVQKSRILGFKVNLEVGQKLIEEIGAVIEEAKQFNQQTPASKEQQVG